MESPLPPSTTGITSLPNEILDKIFRLLEPPALHQSSKVNRFFYIYINTCIGLNARIGKLPTALDFYFLSVIRVPVPINKKHILYLPAKRTDKTKGIKLQGIGEAGINSVWFLSTLRANQQPTFKYPYLVRKLIVDNILSSQKLKSIIQPLTNLNQLILGQNSLLHLRLQDDRLYKELSFPRLRSLIISGKRFDKLFVRSSGGGWHQLIVNILLILRGIQFPLIRELVLQDLKVGNNKHEALIMDALMHFIIRHKALDKLSIGVRRTFQVGQPLPQTLPPIDHQELQLQLDGVQLKSFFIRNTRHGVRTRRTQQLLYTLINSQSIGYKNVLQHFVWIFNHHGVLEVNPSNIIKSNETSLRSIEMIISPSIVEFDCRILASCHSLKILTLMNGKREWRTETGAQIIIPQNTRLTHLDSLPISLKSFRIKGLDLTLEESQFLTRDELKLDVLELENIGIGIQFGLSVESLAQIISRNYVQTICLRNAINSNSLNNNNNDASALGIKFLLSQAGKNAINMKGFLVLKLIANKYEAYYAIRKCHYVRQDGYGYSNDERSNYFQNDATQFTFSLQFPRLWYRRRPQRNHTKWIGAVQVVDFKTHREIEDINWLKVKTRKNSGNVIVEVEEDNLNYQDSDDGEEDENNNSDSEIEGVDLIDNDEEEESQVDSDDDETGVEIDNNDQVDEGVEPDEEIASEEEDEQQAEENESDDGNSSGFESD